MKSTEYDGKRVIGEECDVVEMNFMQRHSLHTTCGVGRSNCGSWTDDDFNLIDTCIGFVRYNFFGVGIVFTQSVKVVRDIHG